MIEKNPIPPELSAPTRTEDWPVEPHTGEITTGKMPRPDPDATPPREEGTARA